MANPEHLEILKQGVEVWNRWCKENPGVDMDLSQVDLSGTHLVGADFLETDLRNSDLSGADLALAVMVLADLRGANLADTILSEANFSEANLAGTNLQRAQLSGTRIDESNLTGANLREASLYKATFNEAILQEADLTGAEIRSTVFADIDFSTVKGLDTMRHWGSSYVDIRTLSRSGGQISVAFLRGCGLSDWEIEAVKLYRPGLTSEGFTDISYKIHNLRINAIQYYSCFISHSHKDEFFAQRLHADLQQKGVRCWFAPEDMKIGDKIRPVIDQSIRVHDKLLLVLSEYSVNSQWVEQEVETALARERNQDKLVLFPVRLDNTVMEIDSGWPALIKNTRHIGDFSRWKDHDAYQQAFERLLRDLKAEG